MRANIVRQCCGRRSPRIRKKALQATSTKRFHSFEKLVAAHPTSSNSYLNYGFAYVDKIPAAGSITQVIMANTALTQFTKSIELKPTWIALYTRGNSYLYWPKVFGRAGLGVTDLPFSTDGRAIRSLGAHLKAEVLRTFAAGARAAGASHLKGCRTMTTR